MIEQTQFPVHAQQWFDKSSASQTYRVYDKEPFQWNKVKSSTIKESISTRDARNVQVGLPRQTPSPQSATSTLQRSPPIYQVTSTQSTVRPLNKFDSNGLKSLEEKGRIKRLEAQSKSSSTYKTTVKTEQKSKNGKKIRFFFSKFLDNHKNVCPKKLGIETPSL